MHLVHIGLVSTSEDHADRFFGDLLGLPKTRTSQLPRKLAEGLFGVDQDLGIAYYGDGDMIFEVFFTGWSEPSARKISHTCISVENLDEFLGRCRAMEYEVREVTKGEHGDHAAQVVLTTHSPHLLDYVDLSTDQVLVFSRNDDGSRGIAPADPARLKTFLDDFQLGEVWFNEGEQGLVAKKS